MTRVPASANNFDELTELLQTAIEKSQGARLYVMSNGSVAQLIHTEYRDDFEADGYWLSLVYENGHRVEI